MKKVIYLTTLTVFLAVATIYFLFDSIMLNSLIYPQWAKYITNSTSMKAIEIDLFSGMVNDGKHQRKFINGKRSEAELVIPRAYITWNPYLNGNDKSSVSIDAALPNMEPYSIIKERVFHGFSKENKAPKNLRVNTHKQWVKIEIGLYGFFNNLCETSCSREESIKKATENTLKDYESQSKDTESIGLLHLTNNTKSVISRGSDAYIPLNPIESLSYIVCKEASKIYNWCNVSSRLNENMYLWYQFEKSHLGQWKEIHEKVKTLASSFVAKHQVYEQ